MDYEALEEWIKQRLADGEDATVYTFIREVMDKARSHDEYRESADAKIRGYEDEIANNKAEMDRLKSHNYDLLMKVPVDENDGDGEVIENNEEDGEIYHIDNLFVDEDERKEE